MVAFGIEDVVSGAVIAGASGFLIRLGIERWLKGRDRRADTQVIEAQKHEDGQQATFKSHEGRLIALETRVTVTESKNDERAQAVGRLEEEHNRLEGRVSGLQDFWRSEFTKLRQELRDDQAAFRKELREDQSSAEERMTALFIGHQQRVHDRLNTIATEQAKGFEDLLDKLVDKVAG